MTELADLRQSAAIEAMALAPLVDGHNDLAWEARGKSAYSPEGLDGDMSGSYQTDIPRLRRGGVGAQFWSVYAPCEQRGADAVTYTLEQIDFVHRMIARYPDTFAYAWSGDDVRRAWRSGRIASLLGAEGGHSIDGSLAVLRDFARLGVRYMTLTHNENTPWADSATDAPVHGGLSDFGRDVVVEMNRLGMLVDLSHVAATTMRDALDASVAPVIFSHSSCRAVTDHPRNVPDDVLERLSGNGGVVMVTYVPAFVNQAAALWDTGDGSGPAPTATVDDVIAHVEHARDVAGIDHIGIGSDYDGVAVLPEGMHDVTGHALLLDRLAEGGWSSADLAKLMGDNILRVLDATVVN
ncbi:membrane dipeptidase [Aeromicrobium sp. A1-2]|uniref:dipeptidase n=1 Tax=Aeromicrobium sp. A1-2 TaxID=2107713 RepID=UPI000E4A85F0|nr:dipeptidase [Aeromicrobium sp. A1-2]AXT86314.1 membrane dipeptidase [Aeromicrobium sp. A1-2]